jgi:lipoprotein-anchoring transpeptidase ErfK/SrfK
MRTACADDATPNRKFISGLHCGELLPLRRKGSGANVKFLKRRRGYPVDCRLASGGSLWGILGMRASAFSAAAAALVLSIATLPLATAPAAARDVVHFRGDASPGTVVVRTGERRLYYVLGDGRAVRYRVGVGKSGKQWTGQKYIDGKHIRPAWAPPAEVKRDKPSLPNVIPGGSPRNPMGAAALTLSGGGQYAIHGTNVPGSIGGFVSYGCIRMLNEDVLDLYSRVSVGTAVVVTR